MRRSRRGYSLSVPLRARVEPLGSVSLGRRLLVYAVVAILTVAALLAPFVASGAPLAQVLAGYARVLSSPTAAYNIARYAAAMMLTGLAGVVAFRSRVWNIGLEGYMILGAVAALAAAHLLSPSTPPGVYYLAETLAALAAGAAAGGVVAALYVLGVNEVVSSMMLYYIAVQVLLFVVYRVWPSAYGGFPKSYLPGPREPLAAGLPSALFAAALLCLAAWAAYRYTRPGLLARLAGSNERALRVAGYSPRLVKIIVLILSSALAALTGLHEALIKGYVDRGFATLGYGFAGITVAFLASLDPLLVIPAALFMGLLYHFGGYASMYIQGGFAAYFYYVQGILLLAVIAARTLPRYRVILEVGRRG